MLNILELYHFVMYNFLLINNIAITIVYVESWVNVVKVDVRCDHRLLQPFLLIASAIGRLNCWWTFHESISSTWQKLFNIFRLLYVCLFYHVPSCIIKWFEVTKIRPVFLSSIIWDFFIETIGNRICCVAVSPTLLNSELSSTR